MGTEKNRLKEMALLSTQNIYLDCWVKKKMTILNSNFLLYWSLGLNKSLLSNFALSVSISTFSKNSFRNTIRVFGSKPFAKVISRLQKLPQTRRELTFCLLVLSAGIITKGQLSKKCQRKSVIIFLSISLTCGLGAQKNCLITMMHLLKYRNSAIMYIVVVFLIP